MKNNPNRNMMEKRLSLEEARDRQIRLIRIRMLSHMVLSGLYSIGMLSIDAYYYYSDKVVEQGCLCTQKDPNYDLFQAYYWFLMENEQDI